MPFVTQGKTNIKYILIVVILAAIVVISGFFIISSGREGAICFLKGGSWERALPLSNVYFCNLRYPDAGQSCTDSNQCEGKCLVEWQETVCDPCMHECSDSAIYNIPPAGAHCETHRSTIGRYGEVENGKVRYECAIP